VAGELGQHLAEMPFAEDQDVIQVPGTYGLTRDGVPTLICDTMACMAQVDRFSVTMPPELGESVRQAAARQGTSVSTWLTAAAADKLRNELLGAALDQWEAEDGPFTQTELDEAASRLGLALRPDVA
jgi:hypothetical protein